MAMNFNQMLKFQQIKNAFKRFDQDHPKFKNFMNAVWREQALKQDAVIEISITSPREKLLFEYQTECSRYRDV